jgi:hypothetical protein
MKIPILYHAPNLTSSTFYIGVGNDNNVVDGVVEGVKIKELKQYLNTIKSWPITEQRLILLPKNIEMDNDERTLKHYQFEDGNIIEVKLVLVVDKNNNNKQRVENNNNENQPTYNKKNSIIISVLIFISILSRFYILWMNPSISRYLGQRMDLSTRLTGFRFMEDVIFKQELLVNKHYYGEDDYQHEDEGGHRPPFITLWMKYILLPYESVQIIFPILVDLIIAIAFYYSVKQRMKDDIEPLKYEQQLLNGWRINGRPRLPSSDQQQQQQPIVDLNTTTTTIPVTEDYVTSGELQDPSSLPILISLGYLLNPISILTCGAKSFAPLTFMFAILSITTAQYQYIMLSAICLSWVTYLDGICWFGVLILPLLVLSRRQQQPQNILIFTLVFLITFMSLITISYEIENKSWNWIQHVYLWSFSYPDLTPNVGLFFYLFASTFSRFREYFLVCLTLYPIFFVIPLHVHFGYNEYRLAVFQAFVGLGIVMLYQPYPELYHITTVIVSLLAFPCYSLASTVVGYLLLVIFGSLILQPLMLYSWIEDRTGNANYYYFQTLAVNVLLAGFIVLAVQAPIRRSRILARIVDYNKAFN